MSSVSSEPVQRMDAQSLQAAISAARASHQSNNVGLWAALLQTLACSEEGLTQALLQHQGIAVLHDEQLRAAICTQLGQAAVKAMVEGQVFLLFEDPWSSAAIQTLARQAGPARLALAQPAQLQRSMSGLPALQSINSPEAGAAPKKAPTAGISAGSAVVSFVDAAIERAYRDGASDIHFETSREGIQVKYRLDGVMASGEALRDPQRSEEVISRIKVMAQLDITERRRPQDGRIHWQPGAAADAVDLRVSVMPSIFGEDAVLRLLDKAQLRHSEQSMSLNMLGFEGGIAEALRSLAQRPHGMLLITGPTGSGKTTTVYAALSEVNDGLEKIITIEDPVEYELPGVLQIPVNEQKGLTFATGLRSILRHDPDKILVGEIRDAETAQIAVQSSLTGHLVFTTVHANSLFDVLGRFQHFSIEAFALASALNGVVVQRLLRQVCPHCRQWRAPTDKEREQLQVAGLQVPQYMPVPAGCAECRHTGYRGRFVVAEVHVLSDRVRDLMVSRASMTEFKQAVYQEPDQRLLVQALAMVAVGKTSLQEVIRVVGLA